MNELSASQEDYLESIYTECLKNGFAKVTDLSKILNVKKASVSEALGVLRGKGLIKYEPYSTITLTDFGLETAKKIFEKHEVMAGFFQNILMLSRAESIENACKIEHVMSQNMFDKMNKFSIYFQKILDENPDIKKELSKLLK